jgi:hypothetical protein
MTQKKGSCRWEVMGDCLTVRQDDGSILTPTADEIFSFVVEGKQSPSLPEFSEDELVGSFFSRYPALLDSETNRGLAIFGIQLLP